MSFNDTHPEMGEDEFFLTNSDGTLYHHYGWKTKRKGNVAYDRDGKVRPGMFPVFVKKKEFDESR